MAQTTEGQRLRRRVSKLTGVRCPRCCVRSRVLGRWACRVCLAADRDAKARRRARAAIVAAAEAREIALADDRVAGALAPRRGAPSLRWAVEVRDSLEM